MGGCSYAQLCGIHLSVLNSISIAVSPRVIVFETSKRGDIPETSTGKDEPARHNTHIGFLLGWVCGRAIKASDRDGRHGVLTRYSKRSVVFSSDTSRQTLGMFRRCAAVQEDGSNIWFFFFLLGVLLHIFSFAISIGFVPRTTLHFKQ